MMQMRDKKALREAMIYMDWIARNADWLNEAIAKHYSAAKAEEFSALELNARTTREGLRKLFISRLDELANPCG
jgi:hypothetical protein